MAEPVAPVPLEDTRALLADHAGSPAAPTESTAGVSWRVVFATVAIALVWPAMHALPYGSLDALLGVGPEGPSRAKIEAEIAGLRLTEHVGHDGQQFYVIARHPLNPMAAAGAVEPVAYRYRRILFPLIGSIFAPGGSRALIVVFLLESLAGVAIGAWALSRLPRAPWWLPLTMALTPGVIAALGRSLSDALGAGLALLAVTLAIERRWGPMLLALVAAAMTRETLLLVALGLAFTPGMPRRIRVATAVLPAAAFAAWAAWVSLAASAPIAEGGAAQLTLPLMGWFSPHVGTTDLMLGLAVIGLLGMAAWRARYDLPQIAVICGLGALMLTCLSDRVTFSWVNSLRPVAPMMPLAIWILWREPQPHAPSQPNEQPANAPTTT